MIKDQLPRANKIKVALIGCGKISKNHIKAISEHQDNMMLVAICDKQENLLIQAQKFILELSEEYTKIIFL